MGKIEFEISGDGGMTLGEQVRYAGMLVEQFEEELQGRRYMEVEGGMSVKLLEPFTFKLRLKPGVR